MSEFIVIIRAVARPGLGLALLACTSEPTELAPSAPSLGDDAAQTEAVSLRRGARELRIRCALGCDAARAELGAQQRACVADPISTPHHVGDALAFVALGCCTEAESAYREACGDDALVSCIARWSAECASGRLGDP